LDRQISLLAYLTSSRAIFGERGAAALDPALRGIDSDLLHIEARFSHEKRLTKIALVFPKTFALLADRSDALVREFAGSSPPFDIGRIENARQFHQFLCACWRNEPPQPPYLHDIAACELALATARAAPDERSCARDDSDASPRSLRRHPSVTLLRCDYDVRAIFGDGATAAIPVARQSLIAVAVVADGDPQIMDIASEVFDLLAALDDWTDPRLLGAMPGAGALFAELAQAGLLEMRG